MANYGRGWEDGYRYQSSEAQEKFQDDEALGEGDWEWLERSPRQKRLREQNDSKTD